MYATTDFVEISYELCGYRYKKDGTEKIINRTSIRDIKYADIETRNKHVKQVDAKVDYSKLMVEVDAPDIVPDETDDLPF
jgi:hypothetical protein